MAIQICPKCKQESFMWTVEGDPYVITNWHCSNCRYDATENELLIQDAPTCGACGDKNLILLNDDEKEYWWCENCDRIQIANQK